MENKTHVGFNKKGELTSGKCEADKRPCPYGNHFADPKEAHDYLEEVSTAFQALEPELREGYQTYVQAMGDSKIPFDEAVEMGFPEDIARLVAGEPTDPKYARENVGKDVEPASVSESDELEALRKTLSTNLSISDDDDDYDGYEPPASMSEAVGEFMAKREASLRDSLVGESHPLYPGLYLRILTWIQRKVSLSSKKCSAPTRCLLGVTLRSFPLLWIGKGTLTLMVTGAVVTTRRWRRGIRTLGWL